METKRPIGDDGKQREVLVAVGAEGGWTDGEISSLSNSGFLPFCLGPRVLRSDIAVMLDLLVFHNYSYIRLIDRKNRKCLGGC